MRKPFYWEVRGAWYLRVKKQDGKLTNIKLSEDESEAFSMWEEMIDRERRLATGSGVTIGDVVGLYATHLEQRVKDGSYSPLTFDRRMDQLSSFLVHQGIETLSVEDLRPFHVLEWVNGKATWNATTKHFAAKAVKEAINWATKVGRIDRNPIQNLEVETGDPRDFLVTNGLYSRLIEGLSDAKNKRRRVRSFKLILMALRLSGCRPGEIIELTADQTDSETWHIQKHKNRRKQKRPRVIYPCPCLSTLAKIATNGRRKGPMFIPNQGEEWTYQKMRQRIDRLKKRVEAPDEFVMYSFRHTSITDALVAGIEIATVAEMHGTSVKMIQDHYGHLCQHQKHMKSASLRLAKHRRSAN